MRCISAVRLAAMVITMLASSARAVEPATRPSPATLTWAEIVAAASGTSNQWIAFRSGAEGKRFSGTGNLVDAYEHSIDVDLSGGSTVPDVRVTDLPAPQLSALKRGQRVAFECETLDLSILMPARHPRLLCWHGKLLPP